MKLHSKSDFCVGICVALVPVLFALGIIKAEWWQYPVTVAIAAAFIYRGLSGAANERRQAVSAYYKETAVALYGRHYYIRTNLPWIMAAVFYPVALVLRFACKIWLPVWLHVLFAALLTAAVFYSIGVSNTIIAAIDRKLGSRD